MEKYITADNLLYKLNIGNQNSSHKRSNQGKKHQEPITKDNSGTPGPMDISIMQKGNNKKKDFKYYNCGKPNHIARNCKSPKKERIPEPKNTYTMEKEGKNIHFIERSRSPKNNNNYKFYQSKPKLSDNSETLQEEEVEIPNRQPVSQNNLQQFAQAIEGTIVKDEDDK